MEAVVKSIQYYKNCMESSNVFAINDFADKYKGHLPEFISFISDPNIAVPGTYKETWKFIEKDLHSLQRHTNMHLIFNSDFSNTPSQPTSI